MGRKSAKTAAERLEATLENFRDWLCVEWGFCGQAGHAPVNFDRETWSAEEFAQEVLRAEGMGVLESDYRKQIVDEFVRRFGPTVSLRDFESG